MRRVTSVLARDRRRGCDVVGACHTLFSMARTYDTAPPREARHKADADKKPWTARRFVSTLVAFGRSEANETAEKAAGVTALCCACGRAGTTGACRLTERSGPGESRTAIGVEQELTFDGCVPGCF
jgi:hypothetical protein